MTRCVHCAEEIREDAAICKHCGRPVPTGARSIAHRGARFGLGSGPDSYAIWDLSTGGAPAAVFEHTPQGWMEAWTRFQAWEPSVPRQMEQNVMVHAPPTNGKAVASLVLGIVWMWGITSILALIFGFLAKSEIDRSGDRQSGRGMAVAGIVLGFVGLGLLLVAIAVVASFPSFDSGIYPSFGYGISP